MSGSETQDEVVLLALDFLVGNMVGTEVGHGSAQDGCIARGEVGHGGIIHLLAALHINTSDVWIRCGESHGSGYQRHLCTLGGTLLGKGKAHLAT